MSLLRASTGPDRPRTQGGYTLVELLVAVGIIGVILVPLFAWVALAIQQQPITRDGLVRSADTGLLAAYLPEDVAVAGAAAVGGSPVPAAGVRSVGLDDCSAATAEASGDAVLATPGRWRRADEDRLHRGCRPSRVASRIPPRVSVWRRCSPDAGAGTMAIQVFADVLADSTVATCLTPRPGAPVPSRSVSTPNRSRAAIRS